VFRSSVGSLAARVRSGELSAPQLLEAHIRRIERVNPLLNALVEPRFEHARKEAAGIADRLQQGEELPLAGVPFVVKETVAVAGMPHTAGSMLRGDRIADKHAVAVQRLMDAGAIVMGLTNTSELGFWPQSSNRLHGATRNPWDLDRSAAGASGAAAALVSSGCAPFAIGSDWVGSNMISAGLCGVFAHKPTGGAVPVTGVLPLQPGRSRRYTVVGPLTRSASDLNLVMRTMAGPDPSDPSSIPMRWDEPRTDWTWRRVLVCDALGQFGNRPSRDVRRALRLTARLLQQGGADVEVWRPGQFARAGEIWLSMIHEGYGLHHTFAATLSEGQRLSLVMEAVRTVAGRSRYTPPTLGMVALERLTKGSYARIQRFCAEGRRLRERMNNMLAGGGVLLMPAWPEVAPKHGSWLHDPRHMLYAALLNVLELPASTAPVAIGRRELPVGIMMVGAQGEDETTISAAMAVERATGAWSPVEV
jgi:fatty acid amide hydrolase 2